MAIVIGQLSPDDWPKYREIRLQALQTSPTSFASTYDECVVYPDEYWRSQLEKSKRKEELLVLCALDQEKVVGMIVLQWHNKSIVKHVTEIHGVYVTSSYRGQGVGKLLLDAVIAAAKQDLHCTKVKLGVNAENTKALKLYTSYGFKVVGKHERELRYGSVYCDELLLEKRL